MTADGAPVERLLEVPFRPLVCVFLPDRLDLVKGAPALRRSHLDRFVAALWPARAATRRAYAQALQQRNALLARVRAGASAADLRTWDLELGRHALALRADRERAAALVAPGAASLARDVGLCGDVEIRYRPRSTAGSPEQFADELADRLHGDLERGFTGHGPHRDDLMLLRDGRELRTYGSQGEQRLALLTLLIAEREALSAERGQAPLLLLDDVMSELDPDRRSALIARVTRDGQCVVTTADREHVPVADGVPVLVLEVDDASVRRGGGGLRRSAPRSASHAVRALTERVAPATGLAAVQRVWDDAVGAALATQARPTGEAQGVVTVTCSSAAWAQELDLMAPTVTARLNAALGAELVRSLRCQTVPARGWRQTG